MTEKKQQTPIKSGLLTEFIGSPKALSEKIKHDEKQKAKERKDKQRWKGGWNLALAALIGVPAAVQAQPAEPCSTPVSSIMEILEGTCGNDSMCLYLRLPGWLRCSLDYDWEEAARRTAKSNADLTRQNQTLVREINSCVQASSLIFSEKANLERENGRLKSRIRKLLQRR